MVAKSLCRSRLIFFESASRIYLPESDPRSDPQLRISEAFEHLTRRTLDVLIPPRCIGCNTREIWLCGQCRSNLSGLTEPLCTVCSRPSTPSKVCGECYRHPPPYEVLRAPWSHTGLARELVHALKFQGQRHLARLIASEMYLLVDPSIDVIVPVPLHRDRFNDRGYNQSELLARELGAQLACRVDNKMLIRTRATVPQSGLDRADRLVNVRGAFSFNRRRDSDRHILLVDDVTTTGATIAACARLLRQHGVDRISAIVATRATDALDGQSSQPG